MDKFVSSFVAEMKLSSRSYWTWLFFCLSLAYVGYTFSFFMKEQDPGGTVLASGFLVQGGIFVAMLFGLAMARREHFSSSDEVYLSLPNGFRSKMLGKMAALSCMLFLFLVSNLFMLYIFYFNADVAAVMYPKATLYLFLYWGLPFLISGLIGMIVGNYVKSKAAYPLLLFIWTLLGPLNLTIYQIPMAVTGMNATMLFHFINLGQTNYTDSFDPVYGLPIESFRWYQKGFLLVLVTGLLWNLTLLKNYSGKMPIRHFFWLALWVGAGTVLAVNFTSSEQAMQTTSHSASSRVYDRDHYERNDAVQLDSPIDYEITSYDIELQTDEGMQSTVQMQLTPQATSDRMVFTLYHNLKVTRVENGEGRALQFRQQGDQTEITFPSKVAKGKPVNITVRYEGLSSPYFFANGQAVMLPNYFPWLPTEGAHQAMQVSEFGVRRTPLAPQHEIEFTLRYRGAVKLYTNLPQVAPNVWKGTLPKGLTIAGGMLTETQVGSTRVIFPVTLDQMIFDVPDYLARTERALDMINRHMRVQMPSDLPDTLFFLTTPTETNSFTGDIWMMQDHFIVNVNQTYNQGLLKNEISQIEKLLFAWNRTEDTVQQPLDMQVMLVNSMEYLVLSREGDSSSSNLKRIQERNQARGKNRESEVLKQIMAFLETNLEDQERTQEFFQKWTQQMQQNKTFDWEDLAAILVVSKGGQ